MSVTKIENTSDLDAFLKSKDILVIHFYAPWAEQCTQMNELIDDLSTKDSYKGIKFAKVEAEEAPELSIKYKVSAVPEIIFVKNSDVIDRVTGAHPAVLGEKLKKYLTQPVESTLTKSKPLSGDERLKQLINQAKCMLFMKGNPQAPRCGFSRTITGILDGLNIDYQTFDILEDNDVREGLKKFSNWPTYPQLYLDGELLGGLDIVKEMKENGELEEMLPKKS